MVNFGPVTAESGSVVWGTTPKTVTSVEYAYSSNWPLRVWLIECA